VVARQDYLNTCIDFLVTSEMWDLHDVQQSGMCEVHSPLLRGEIQVLALGSS
jgi:hypothetical protein